MASTSWALITPGDEESTLGITREPQPAVSKQVGPNIHRVNQRVRTGQHFIEERYSEAIAAFEARIRCGISNQYHKRQTYKQLLILYKLTNNHDKAITLCSAALIDPKYEYKAELWVWMASAYQIKGDNLKALHAITKARLLPVSTDRQTRALEFQVEGLVCMDQGLKDKAAHAFIKQLDYIDDTIERIETLSIIYMQLLKLNKPKDAIIYMKKVLECDGLSSEQKGAIQQSISVTQERIDLEKTNETVPKNKAPTKRDKGKERMLSPEDLAFTRNLKEAKKQATLHGHDWQKAVKGLQQLRDLMRNGDLKQKQRNDAKAAWLVSCKALCVYLRKRPARIVALLKDAEEELRGTEETAQWCRKALEDAKKKEAKSEEIPLRQGKAAPSHPSAPHQKKATNPRRQRKKAVDSKSSDESPDGSSSSPGISVSETTRILIRQESLRLVAKANEDDQGFDARAALAFMLDKYGPAARNPALQALNKATFLLSQRKSIKPSNSEFSGKMYRVVMSRPDLESEVPAGCKEKYTSILEELKMNPRGGTIGSPKKLMGQFKGYMRRKLDSEHRVVYCVNDQTGEVTVHSARGHYKNLNLPKRG